MNPLILDSRAKPVNLLLGALDENFEWDASKKLLAFGQGNIGSYWSPDPSAEIGVPQMHRIGKKSRV